MLQFILRPCGSGTFQHVNDIPQEHTPTRKTRHLQKAPNMSGNQWLVPEPDMGCFELIKLCIKRCHDLQGRRPQICRIFCCPSLSASSSIAPEHSELFRSRHHHAHSKGEIHDTSICNKQVPIIHRCLCRPHLLHVPLSYRCLPIFKTCSALVLSLEQQEEW